MKNNKQLSIGFIIKAAIISAVASFLLTVLIGGFFKVGNTIPTTVSANENTENVETFSETLMSGITDQANVSDEQNNVEIYRTVSPGVVLISTGSRRTDLYGEPDKESGTGSGVIINKRGYILTNEHVVRGGRSLSVNLGGDRVFKAQLVGSDPDTDLAVIKIDAPEDSLTVISFGDSDALTVGQKVLAIGNPLGLDRTLTTGLISGLQRPIRSRNSHPIEGAIQTDASINPGNSGGPLLDKYGRMIGVNSQFLSPSGASNGIGFAIPVSIVKRVVPQLNETGKVNRARLGIATKSVQELSRQGVRFPIENGLLIIKIAPESSAAKADLRETTQEYDGGVSLGDIITAVEGNVIKTVDELYKALDGKNSGNTIQIEVWRDGGKKTISVKLEAQNADEYEQKTSDVNKRRRQKGY